MKFKARDLVFVAIVVVAVGGLWLLSRKSSRIPAMPVNEAHREAKTREQCLACHTPPQMTALMDAHKHPGKWRDQRVNCTQCHTSPASDASSLRLPAAPPPNARAAASLSQAEIVRAQLRDSEELLLWLKQRRN